MEVNSVVWFKVASSENWMLGKVLSIVSEGEDLKKKKEKFSFSIQSYSTSSPFSSQNKYFQSLSPSVFNIQSYRYQSSINEFEEVKLANEKDDDILTNSKLILEKNLNEDDLISLVHLHEPSILFSLLQRFKSKKIYTLTGPVLLAINPFQDLGLYTKENVEIYRSGGEQGAEALNALPPHVYRIADKAFRCLLEAAQKKINGSNQSILVSGESGAGKTETTKYIMKYLADITKSGSSSKIGIEDLVLQSNPILESFGNAQTLRNDNSSRFGKFIEIHFTAESGSFHPHITGSTIRTYLLEKVRLVYQGEGEKNFHCFYEMLRACPQDLLEKRGLTFEGIDKKGKERNFKPSFRYLSSSSLSKGGMIHHISDYEEEEKRYNEVFKAMKDMNFTDDEFSYIYDFLAAILHLGNLKFKIKDSCHGDGSSGQECEILPNSKEKEFICTLLGFEESKLIKSLCQKEIVTRDETIQRGLTIAESDNIRDALAKSIYGALFDWLVERINISISEKNNSKKSTVYNFIGVLDIFGFENFPQNSFEQLCINYTNETLQQHFNQYIFEYEQSLYEKEGLPWTFIEYPDNKATLDLLENKREGIFALIDDSGKFQWSNQTSLYNRFNEVLSKNSRFEVNSKLKAEMKFQVNHYAGLVTYDSQGFLEKNNDILSTDLTKLLKSSTNTFLINKIIPKIKCVDDSNPTGAKSFTVSSEFRRQLRELIENISKTTPHYIRCIKPNSKGFSLDNELKSNGKDSSFDSQLVLNQLRCCGVLEALKVARAGYPFSFEFSQFFKKFSMLSPFLRLDEKLIENNSKEIYSLVEESKKYYNQLESKKLDPKGLVEAFSNLIRIYFSYNLLIKTKSFLSIRNTGSTALLSLTDCGIAHGYRLVFLRKYSNDILQSEIIKIQTKALIIIQKYYRSFKQCRKYNKIRSSTFRIQCWYRQKKSVKILTSLRKNKASIYIQKMIRRFITRKNFLRTLFFTIKIQSIFRQYKAKIFTKNLRRFNSSIRITSLFRMYFLNKKYKKFHWSIIKIQVRFRMRVSRRIFLALRVEARSLNTIMKERDNLQERIKLLEGVISQLLSQNGDSSDISSLLSGGGDSILGLLPTLSHKSQQAQPIEISTQLPEINTPLKEVILSSDNIDQSNISHSNNHQSNIISPNAIYSSEYQELLKEYNLLKAQVNLQSPYSPQSVSSPESSVSLSSYNDLLVEFNSLKKHLMITKRKLRMLEQKPSTSFSIQAPSGIEYYDIYPNSNGVDDFEDVNKIEEFDEPSNDIDVADIYPDSNEIEDFGSGSGSFYNSKEDNLMSVFDDDSLSDESIAPINFQTVGSGVMLDSDDEDDNIAPIKTVTSIRTTAIMVDSDDESFSGSAVSNTELYNTYPGSDDDSQINNSPDLYDTYHGSDDDDDDNNDVMIPKLYESNSSEDFDLYNTYGSDGERSASPHSSSITPSYDLYNAYPINDENNPNVIHTETINKLFSLISTNGSLEYFLELSSIIPMNWTSIFYNSENCDSKVSLLHFASYYCHLEIIQYFVKNHPHELNILTKEGWNAFHFARNSSVVELLATSNMLDINLRGCDSLGTTPLSGYFFPYHIDSLILDNVEDYNKNISYPTSFPDPNIDLLSSLLKNGAKKSIWYRELGGLRRYPLHWAALRANTEEVNLLIKESDTPPFSDLVFHPSLNHIKDPKNNESFPIDLLDCEGYTPLMLTTASENPQGHQLQVLMLLLSYKASPILSSLSGITPLHFIISNRKLKSRNITLPIVECILEYGGDPNAKDMEGCTPVIVSIAYRLWSICQVLLKHGGDLNLTCSMSSVFLKVGNISDILRDFSWRMIQEEEKNSSSKSKYNDLINKFPYLCYHEIEIYNKINESHFQLNPSIHLVKGTNNQVISDINFLCGKLYSRDENSIKLFTSARSPINQEILKELDDDPETKEMLIKTLMQSDCCGSDLLTIKSRMMLYSHICVKQSDILTIRDRCMNCGSEYGKTGPKTCIHCKRILCITCCPNQEQLSVLPSFLSVENEVNMKVPLCILCKNCIESTEDSFIEDEYN